MNYFYLNSKKEQPLLIQNIDHRNQVIANLSKLRKALADKTEGIPEKKLSGNLILGTWNIRELGNTKYNGRMTESLYYLAEIISRFDLIAIQEVRDNLTEFNNICRILGNDWGIFISLVTDGISGNNERMAFLYDKRTVSFKNIAGQIILPGKKYANAFARAPYMIRFQSGWLNFDICTVHIYYGKASVSSPEYKRRVEEISNLTGFLKDNYVEKQRSNNLFVLGDFNIENDQSETYKAATSSSFSIPDAILKNKLPGSNVSQNKIYDQILYYNKFKDITFKNAGIFNFYKTVFDKLDGYEERIKKHTGATSLTDKEFDEIKTYQMSDHLPLWVEMNTDHTESYLDMISKKTS
ncbi:endonuclease/exonuclease/phosphatase family protein [Pedobacter sp.]|uniref:endonuclease/exonuclease/phosphatase family protein n=1 Tax=Pedobacter sp. TaxID=1411316 RepID=UPI003BABAA12